MRAFAAAAFAGLVAWAVRLLRVPRPAGGAASPTPSPLAAGLPNPYVESIGYWGEGEPTSAVLRLTRAGIELGRKGNHGPLLLAHCVMSQPGWRGRRGESDVASEIKAHCVAWHWLPPLRARANPIDLQFAHSWPGNLMDSLRPRLLRF